MKLLALVFIMACSSSYAQKPSVLFSSSTVHEAELSLSKLSFQSYKTTEKQSETTLYGGYHYHLKANVQIGAEGGLLAYPDGADKKSLYAIVGLYTWNFSDNIREAFYAQAGAGMYPAFDDDTVGGEYKSAFSVLAGIGKRFEVWGKINYKPYLRVWKKGDEDVSYELQALNFSIYY